MIAAIVQARIGSTRLPGKVMKEIMGKPLLWHLVNRLRWSRLIDKIIIATTNNEKDKPILKLAEEMGIEWFTGSEEDVLDRYYQTARKYNLETIVRITADCPLIDPEVVDMFVKTYLDSNGKLDYIRQGPKFPDGFDAEVFSFSALKKAWKEAKNKFEREHVTAYIWKNPQLFNTLDLKNDEDLSYIRCTVDYEEDLKVIREIFKNLYKEDKIFHVKDVLDFLRKHPEVAQLNKHLINPDYLKFIAEQNSL